MTKDELIQQSICYTFYTTKLQKQINTETQVCKIVKPDYYCESRKFYSDHLYRFK